MLEHQQYLSQARVTICADDAGTGSGSRKARLPLTMGPVTDTTTAASATAASIVTGPMSSFQALWCFRMLQMHLCMPGSLINCSACTPPAMPTGYLHCHPLSLLLMCTLHCHMGLHLQDTTSKIRMMSRQWQESIKPNLKPLLGAELCTSGTPLKLALKECIGVLSYLVWHLGDHPASFYSIWV